MNPFEKNKIEHIVLETLKRKDSRFANLRKSERPDFISNHPDLGVEVTVSDFPEFIEMFLYKGKKLIEFVRMKGIKPQQKKEFALCTKIISEILSNQITDDTTLKIANSFIKNFYFERRKNIYPILNFKQYYDLDPNTNMYHKSYFRGLNFIGQTILNPQPFSFWNGNIVYLMLDQTKRKNELLKGYQSKSENILVIVNFSSDLEEYKEFEQLIMLESNIGFEKIIILNFMFGNVYYEIDLSS